MAHLSFNKLYGIPIVSIFAGSIYFLEIKKKKRPGLQSASCLLDDVTKMNETKIHKLIHVSSEGDIIDAVKKTRAEKKTILPFGTRHTMGGQCIPKGGYAIDMTTFNKIISCTEDTVTFQTGVTWSDLIHYLNQQGKTLETLQSYSSFSAGGSIGANIHGITSDYSLQHSIISMKVVLADGTLVECNREKNYDLFRHVIGGFGMFGIVTEATVRTVPNYKLLMQSKLLDITSFSKEYLKLVDNPDICIKLGRLKTTDFKNVMLFYFSKDNNNVISAKLNKSPHEMTKISSLFYKWLMGCNNIQNLRFFLERILNRPLDWSTSVDINSNLYESATSLAELWSPLFNLNKTHILKEYFVPKDKLEEWINYADDILHQHKFNNSTLLNATVRFVKQDTTSVLNYAKEDMFAIVLYFRLDKKFDGDNELQKLDEYLRSYTVDKLNGTFYLPYRRHHTIDDIRKAYPNFDEFVKAKYTYDPDCVFSSIWWNEYGTHQHSTQNKPELDKSLHHLTQHRAARLNEQPERNINSFDYLHSTKHGQTLANNFARYIFPLVESDVSNNIIKENQKDFAVCYKEIQQLTKELGLKKNWRKLMILSNQRKELVEQTKQLLDKVFFSSNLENDNKDHAHIDHDHIDGLVTIGDPGRYVKNLEKAFKIQGTKYVVHSEFNLMDIFETNTLFTRSLGTKVKVDYNNIGPDYLKEIPDESVELVTLYIGIHHFDETGQNNFLKEVSRILKPGGVFILRDHNGTSDMKPLLNYAHSYYNALTEETFETDQNEYRNFKTIEEIRNSLNKHNLIDSKIYKKQHLDPTENYLMAFVKKDVLPKLVRDSLNTNYKRSVGSTYTTVTEWYDVSRAKAYSDFIIHTPWYHFPFLAMTMQFWSLFFSQTKEFAKKVGWKSVVSDSGIHMDLFIGTQTSAEYIIKSIVALPLRCIFTLPFFKADNTVKFILKSENIPETLICKSLNSWKTEESEKSYHMIEYDRYTLFTELMKKLATVEENQMIEIAGNKFVQLRISIKEQDKELATNEFNSFPLKITSQYNLPTTLETNLICEVSVSELLNLIRFVQNNKKFSANIEHIYCY